MREISYFLNKACQYESGQQKDREVFFMKLRKNLHFFDRYAMIKRKKYGIDEQNIEERGFCYAIE